jgi:hypothetical protein
VDLASNPHRVAELEVVGGHRLHLAFEDGVSGELDASNVSDAGR